MLGFSRARNGKQWAIRPGRDDRRSHAALFGMLQRGFVDAAVRQMQRVGQAIGARGNSWARFRSGRRLGIVERGLAVFRDGFDGQRAGDFPVRFAAHAVRNNEKLERLDDTIRIFVIFSDAPDIGARPHVQSQEIPSGWSGGICSPGTTLGELLTVARARARSSRRGRLTERWQTRKRTQGTGISAESCKGAAAAFANIALVAGRFLIRQSPGKRTGADRLDWLYWR